MFRANEEVSKTTPPVSDGSWVQKPAHWVMNLFSLLCGVTNI